MTPAGELLLDRSGHLVDLDVLSLIVVVNRPYGEVLGGHLITDYIGEGLAHPHVVGHGCLDPLAIVREEAAEISGHIHSPDGSHQVGKRLGVNVVAEELTVLLVCHLTPVRTNQTEEAGSNIDSTFGLTLNDHLSVEHIPEDSVGSRFFERIGGSDSGAALTNLTRSLNGVVPDQLQCLKELLVLHEGRPMIQNGEDFTVIIYEEALLSYGRSPEDLKSRIEVVLPVDVQEGLRNSEEVTLVTQLLFLTACSPQRLR